MEYAEAIRAVLNLPMSRWLGIARRYDVTAVEVVNAMSGDADDRVAVLDVVTLLAANEVRRAEQIARGESPKDVFAELEELSISALIDLFADPEPVDRDAELVKVAEEDEPMATFPGDVAAEGPVEGDGGRVVAAAPGADVSGDADQPGDVRAAVAG